jgi:hypothetical protein
VARVLLTLLVRVRVVLLRLPRWAVALLRILSRLTPILAVRHRARLPMRDVREALNVPSPRLMDASWHSAVHDVDIAGAGLL